MDQNQLIQMMLMMKIMRSIKKKKPSTPEAPKAPEVTMLPTAQKYTTMMKHLDVKEQHPDAEKLFGDTLVPCISFADMLEMMFSRCHSSYQRKEIEDDGFKCSVDEHVDAYADEFASILACHIFDVPKGTANGKYEVHCEQTTGQFGNILMYDITSDNFGLDEVEFSIFADKINDALGKIFFYSRMMYGKAGGGTEFVDRVYFTKYDFVVCDGKAMAYSADYAKMK